MNKFMQKALATAILTAPAAVLALTGAVGGGAVVVTALVVWYFID